MFNIIHYFDNFCHIFSSGFIPEHKILVLNFVWKFPDNLNDIPKEKWSQIRLDKYVIPLKFLATIFWFSFILTFNIIFHFNHFIDSIHNRPHQNIALNIPWMWFKDLLQTQSSLYEYYTDLKIYRDFTTPSGQIL